MNNEETEQERNERLDEKRREDLEYIEDMKEENDSDAWDINEGGYL